MANITRDNKVIKKLDTIISPLKDGVNVASIEDFDFNTIIAHTPLKSGLIDLDYYPEQIINFLQFDLNNFRYDPGNDLYAFDIDDDNVAATFCFSNSNMGKIFELVKDTLLGAAIILNTLGNKNEE